MLSPVAWYVFLFPALWEMAKALTSLGKKQNTFVKFPDSGFKHLLLSFQDTQSEHRVLNAHFAGEWSTPSPLSPTFNLPLQWALGSIPTHPPLQPFLV